MSDPMKNAWNDVAESFSALGRSMKDRYQGGPTAPDEEAAQRFADQDSAAGGGQADPTADLRSAFDQLLAAGKAFGDRLTGVVRDDDLKSQARQIGTSINDAIEATLDQIGQEVRGFFKPGRKGDDAAGPVDVDVPADLKVPAEVDEPGDVTDPLETANHEDVPPVDATSDEDGDPQTPTATI